MSIRDIFKLLLLLLLIIAAVLVFNRVESVQSREETGIVRDAVRQAAITCYAVEGAYPEDVDYLREYYHLAYDADRYAVTLEGFASNVIPDIFIEDRYAGSSGQNLFDSDSDAEFEADKEEGEMTGE